MANEVMVTMPLALTPEMIRAVRDHETTKTEDRNEWHRRLGWLLCAWDVILGERRNTPGTDLIAVPREAHYQMTTGLMEGRNQWAEDYGEETTPEAEYGKRLPILLVGA